MSKRIRGGTCPNCGKRARKCSCQKKSATRFLRWCVVIILVLAAIVLAIVLRNDEKNETVGSADTVDSGVTEEKSLRERLLDWPLPPAPPSTVEVRRPSVPTELPPVRIIGGQLSEDDLRKRLGVLLNQHPIQEIRSNLDNLLRTDAVGLIWSKKPPEGVFLVLRPSALVSIPQGFKGENSIPAFQIDANWLARLAGEEAILEAMLLLFHEYQHYKDWADDPPDKQGMWI
ncbi:MAG: hypothetical protein Q8N81_07585, partial [bacterium]|nr:hypothetical protein [bacterium]